VCVVFRTLLLCLLVPFWSLLSRDRARKDCAELLKEMLLPLNESVETGQLIPCSLGRFNGTMRWQGYPRIADLVRLALSHPPGPLKPGNSIIALLFPEKKARPAHEDEAEKLFLLMTIDYLCVQITFPTKYSIYLVEAARRSMEGEDEQSGRFLCVISLFFPFSLFGGI
jgi:hypothetical protein